MGAWGSKLYANDTTCDVRDTYLDFLQDQLSNKESYEKTLDKYIEYIGDDEEPLFWFALAETQWKVGRLMPAVKENALHWIEKSTDRNFFPGHPFNVAIWNKELLNLKDKLNSTMRSEKRIEKLELNPWRINDVYAYQFHKDESRDAGIFGKYMLMQKIGECPYYEKQKIRMQIHLIDHIFNEMPKLDDVNNYRILPSDSLEFNRPLQMHTGITLVKNTHYPKKYLTYLGNIKGPMHKSIVAHNCIDWWNIEEQIKVFSSVWNQREYESTEDGIYRYNS